MALKQLFLGQRDLHRQDRRAAGRAGRDRVERLGPHTAGGPRVSVLLTVYNYEDAASAKAIRSVALSRYRDHELVVVDDASTDGSPGRLGRELSRLPVAARPADRARAATAACRGARNLAAEHARGDYVFILDADNFVYPHRLGAAGRCARRRSGGRLRVRDPGGVRHRGPDRPEELARLGPAPAALRQLRGRDGDDPALGARGGRRLHDGPRLYGWEDFALWCALADAASAACASRRSSARYRSSLQSMISLTDIDASGGLVRTASSATRSLHRAERSGAAIRQALQRAGAAR